VTLHRRDVLRAALAVPLLAACKKAGGPKATPSPAGPVALQDVGGAAANVLDIGDAEPELLKGSARYAFGLVDTDGPVSGARTTVYLGPDPAKPPTLTVPGTELTDEGLTGRGLYVAQVPFPAAGTYYVAVVAETRKGLLKGGTKVTVAKSSKSPVPGAKMPAIKTPTTANLLGANPLCSRRPKPCTMHNVSLDAALRNGKPTVVVFAAPAFCQTELCGPDVEIVQSFAKKHAGKANFLHVEAYRGATNPTNGKLAPALEAMHFDTEPWLYVVDRKGVVTARISGAFASSELAAQLGKLGL
jgi:hypothetical protein